MSNATKQHKQADGDVAVQERTSVQPTAAEFEEFERFFRDQMKAPAEGGAGATLSDPLMAELARIVGQERPGAPQAQPPRLPEAHDPFAPAAAGGDLANDPLRAFEEELRRFDAAHQPLRVDTPPPAAANAPAYDDFDVTPYPSTPAPAPFHDHAPQLAADPRRADLEAAMQAAPEPEYVVETLPGDFPAAPEPDFVPPVEEKPRSKKVLMMLGAAAAIGLVGVIGSLGFSSKPRVSGDAPVIAAKPGPTKEKPADPGGVEISGQDRQVLAKKTEEPKGAATVVSKEEQPVDLNQTPKRDAARVILPAPTGGSAPAAPAGPILMPQGSQPAPSQAAPSGSALEPKKVRSVRISSDGDANAAAAAAAAAPPAPAAPVAPAAPAAPKVTTPSLASAPLPAPISTPKSDARPATAAKPAQTTTPQAPRPAAPRPAVQAAAPSPSTGGEGGPMSLQPSNSGIQQAKATAPKATATPSTPAASGGSGGYSVQLAAPGSEAEARTVISKIKSEHGDALGGYTPAVRKADVNGRTVHRVRVGGLSKDAATSLCNKLKADGASCFIAGN